MCLKHGSDVRHACMGTHDQCLMQARGMVAMQLLLLLSMATTPLLTVAQLQAGEQVVSVRTGQELADAVAAWSISGTNTTIQIEVPFISVRSATFQTREALAARAGVQPFTSGRLIVTGQVDSAGQPATVLDAGMREGLIPGLYQSAKLEMSNLIFINLCEVAAPLLNLYSAPGAVALFLGTGSYVSRTYINTCLYGRQAALQVFMYGVPLYAADLPEIRELITNNRVLSGLVGELHIELNHLTPYSVDAKFFSIPDMYAFNSSAKALENPDDPLVAQWNAQGLLMPPRQCNGKPVVDEAAQRLFAPLWISVQQSTFASSLANASRGTATPRIIRVLPIVLLLSGESVTAPDTASYRISSRLLLISTQNGNLTSWDQQLTINLNQRVGLLNIAPGADVVFKWLGLTGLAAQVPSRLPPSLAGRSPDSLLPSVFPLAAFNTSADPGSWNRTAQVVLSNVTLSIPPDDYLALFILAHKQGKAGIPACAGQALHQQVDQLQAGISQIEGSSAGDTSLEQHLKLQEPQLFLTSFTGWGLNASDLRLVPTARLDAPVCQTSQQLRLAQPQVVGLTVGLTCGGVAIAALVAALVFWRRRRRLAEHASSSKPASEISSKVQSTVLESGPCDCHVAMPDCSTRDGGANAYLSLDPPQSSLTQFVRRAELSQEQVFASIAGRTAEPDASTGVQGSATDIAQPPGTKQQADQQQLHTQVQELAAKLQQEGDQHLVLAGVLGAGGGGTVYMGLWRGLRVAVKTVIFHQAADEVGNATGTQRASVLSQRANLETAICASLGHRNVVATYHYEIKSLQARSDEQSEGGLQINMAPDTKRAEQRAYKLFLIQELCNTSLGDALHEGLLMKPGTAMLDLNAALVVLLDIASGLEYLHSKSIVHGDLKPDNVLLKVDLQTAEGVIAKLADFGLSARLHPGHTHVSNFRSGTPFYVAPEVAERHQVSPASDMYSFGVVVWEMLMQKPPYIQTSAGSFAWNPLFPNFSPSRMPPLVFVQLTHRCLQHDHQARPSAGEAAGVLKAVLSSLS